MRCRVEYDIRLFRFTDIVYPVKITDRANVGNDLQILIQMQINRKLADSNHTYYFHKYQTKQASAA